MNRLMAIMFIFPLIFSCFTGKLSETVCACMDGASSAVLLMLSISGIMCLWTGIMRVADNAGAVQLFSKILSPVIRLLFPHIDINSQAVKYITLNITANLLGLANGATPMGIRAMQELDQNHTEYATDDMCTFAVLNTAALTLVPTSVMAIRQNAKISVIVPIWITSVTALCIALVCVKIACRIRRGIK